MSIWAGGIGVLLVLGVVRGIGFRRVLRHARPASPETVELVRAAAAELGMRRAPVTLITGDRVSPMVWCGLRPRLVLPVGLWRELDAGSRRAVLLHELAHLKRMDHWLCWLATVVGMVYWWHPVAWWARKRIRDEADAACDAWVTSLMPASRRVYAEALVTTRWFLSSPGRREPSGLAGAGALGVMSGRTKHLARRLKMVMTQRVAPRTSKAGALMAMGVLMAGMFVMPGLACPPEEAAKEKARAEIAAMSVKAAKPAKAPKAAKAPKEIAAGEAVTDPTDAKPEFFGEAPALEAMRRSEGRAGATNRYQNRPDDDQMLRRLEERLRRLEDQLRQLERSGGRSSAHPVPPGPPHTGGGMALSLPGHPGVGGRSAALASPARPSGMRSTGAGVHADAGDVSREYRLSEGKLRALTELMAREDVPVMIQRHDDKIVVLAPESKQRVFAAFVKLIHPEAQIPLVSTPSESAAPRGRIVERRAAMDVHVQGLKDQMKAVEKQRRDTEKAAEKARQRSEAAEQQGRRDPVSYRTDPGTHPGRDQGFRQGQDRSRGRQAHGESPGQDAGLRCADQRSGGHGDPSRLARIDRGRTRSRDRGDRREHEQRRRGRRRSPHRSTPSWTSSRSRRPPHFCLPRRRPRRRPSIRESPPCPSRP